MYLKAIGQGFHAKPSPTLGSLPAGLNLGTSLRNQKNKSQPASNHNHSGEIFQLKEGTVARERFLSYQASCDSLSDLFEKRERSCIFFVLIKSNVYQTSVGSENPIWFHHSLQTLSEPISFSRAHCPWILLNGTFNSPAAMFQRMSSRQQNPCSGLRPSSSSSCCFGVFGSSCLQYRQYTAAW